MLAANAELVSLYWHLGNDILQRQHAARWGDKVLQRLASDLREAFPEMKGFSLANLKFMRAFAQAWPDAPIGQQAVSQLPWGHNVVLLTKLKDPTQRLRYAEHAIAEGWSRSTLEANLRDRLLERQGRAVTNFAARLPQPHSALAHEALKDPYLFDFLSLGNEAHERAIESGLVQHITRLLLELGNGFAFLGRQVRLEVEGEEFFIDLLFYFTQAELLYDLAGQAVAHYQAQNYSENELHEVFDTYGAELARLIRAEMMAHFWEEATDYEVQVSRGFTELKPCNYTAVAGQTAHNYRETVTELSKIKQMLFGGFLRCLYPLQKFDSDTERRFAVILERDALKWFKPAKGQFQIYYKLGSEQPEYIPDFVAETDSMILMVETKKRDDLSSDEVKSKAAAAVRWCSHASSHSATVGSKPWRYLLVPHDEIKESDRLTAFLRFELKA